MGLDLVSQIRGISDPVERNYAITAKYHRLSRQVAEVIGRRDANWLTFGAWASFSAGRFIRGEAGPFRWGADSVAAGNQAIICDIAPRFERFLALAADSTGDQLLHAVVTDESLTETPQLAEAFRCYTEAGDPGITDKTRAELLLRANTLVAHHEQRFADDFIDEAMPLGGLVGLITTRFVKITTPEGDLDVCEDVPRPRYLHGDQWPGVLADLADPRLIELVRSYGQNPGDVRYSNAPVWESFDERMGFIVCFFRAYQRDPSFFEDPGGAVGIPLQRG